MNISIFNKLENCNIQIKESINSNYNPDSINNSYLPEEVIVKLKTARNLIKESIKILSETEPFKSNKI